MCTLIGGYIYDIFGRKMTLFVLITFSGFMLVFYPIVAPNTTLFYIVACMFNLFADPISNNPLVLDYVIKEDRGAALSFGL